MKIAKEFRWEMGHRLPDHSGGCKNIHGHSYKMIVSLEGETNEYGMIMDYYDLGRITEPIIEKLDHAFMVSREDADTIAFLKKLNSKMIIVEFQTTVENICRYLLNEIKKTGFPGNITKIVVRVYEAEDDYAEDSLQL